MICTKINKLVLSVWKEDVGLGPLRAPLGLSTLGLAGACGCQRGAEDQPGALGILRHLLAQQLDSCGALSL